MDNKTNIKTPKHIASADAHQFNTWDDNSNTTTIIDAYKWSNSFIDTSNKIDTPNKQPSFNLNEPFDKVLYQMKTLREAKNKDYGNAFGELFNEYGLNYSIMHLHEKLNRIKSVHKNNKANNESIKDSLIDLANYAIMTYIEMDNTMTDM